MPGTERGLEKNWGDKIWFRKEASRCGVNASLMSELNSGKNPCYDMLLTYSLLQEYQRYGQVKGWNNPLQFALYNGGLQHRKKTVTCADQSALWNAPKETRDYVRAACGDYYDYYAYMNGQFPGLRNSYAYLNSNSYLASR